MQSRNFRSLLLIIVCFIPALAMAQRYTITDLGPLSPTGINSWAQVVGNYNNQAYIWAFGRTRSLGTLPGGTSSYAAGINDLGVVVGTANGQGTVVVPPDNMFGYAGPNEQCSDLTQPFIWKQQMQGLGRIAPASDVEALAAMLDPSNPSLFCGNPFYGSAINDRGQVVGYTADLGDAYQWGILAGSPRGNMILFGSSFPATLPNAISDSGQIVGEDYLTATSWRDGSATDLGGLPGDVSISAANAVNDLGQIVGWSFGSSTDHCCDLHVRAVLWTQHGAIRDLGTLSGDNESVAKKINLFGLVVGNSGTTYTYWDPLYMGGKEVGFFPHPLDVVGRPFIWSERNGMRDLNKLIPQNSGWVLQSAADINVWGQIVGSGTRNGQPHGFLLTPLNPFQLF